MQSQTRTRQVQLFKTAVSNYEISAGVKIQRIPGSYLLRIMKPWITARVAEAEAGRDPDRLDPQAHKPDDDDAVVDAIFNFRRIFSACDAKNVDMFGSAEAVAEIQWEHGSDASAALLLAWKVGRDGRLACVGALTICKSYERSDLGTSDDIVHEDDHAVLKVYFHKTLFIDGVCSTSKGAGRALVMSAVKFALSKKDCKGVLCLSFSAKKLQSGAYPESHDLFTKLHFDTVIDKGRFKPKHHHGSWMHLSFDVVPFNAFLEHGVAVCARRGFTKNTHSTYVSRCPA